jgi:iron complex outermembrane recepter protein
MVVKSVGGRGFAVQSISRASLMAGAALVALAATPAFAQNASVAEAEAEVQRAETVVVTGIRRGIENAIAVKKDLNVIAEVVSAEDIGKLPDVSIAESIARLPGLAAQRVDGRAQVISIRGLGPDFTTTLINGREQVSTGDNRAVEFDQFPSELLSSVAVYKTPTASLVAQGLAGTADLRTIRPLSQNRRIVQLGARYEWNSLGGLQPDMEDTGYRLTATYVDQFMDGRLGVAFGIADMRSAGQNERTERYEFGWRDAANVPNGTYVPGGMKAYAQSNVLERTGVMGAIEFKPTDTFSTMVDLYYSDFEEEQFQRGYEMNHRWGGSTIRPGSAVIQNGVVTSAIFDNVGVMARNIYKRNTAEVFAAGWRTDWDLTDQFSVNLDVSHSRAERESYDFENQAATGRNDRDTVRYTSRGDSMTLTPARDYNLGTRMVLTNPLGWGAGYLKEPQTDDELTAVRLAADYEFEKLQGLTSIEFGVNYTTRTKSRRVPEFVVQTANDAVTIPQSALRGSVDLGFASGGRLVAYDPKALVAAGVYRLIFNTGPWAVGKAWTVDEEVTTAFVKVNIESELGTMPVTGNFGIQAVHVDQSSTGRASSGDANIFSFTEGTDYTDYLPSLNLAVEVSDDTFVRVSLARVTARPRMDEMRASREFGYNEQLANSTDLNRSPWGGSGGNPYLRPWIANTADISIEKYFGRRGYIALAAYYKDLETYIRPGGRVLVDFSNIPVPNYVQNPANRNPRLRQGFLDTPDNGQGGSITGAEFTVSVPLGMISEALEGFGVQASAAINDSDVIWRPNEPNTKLPGLSETTGNVTAYYERYGFQARISARYRSEFTNEITGFGADKEYKQNAEETVVDAQLGYSFNEGMLNGLSVLLQANNISNEPYRTSFNDPFRPLDYSEYGTTYLFGVNYRF